MATDITKLLLLSKYSYSSYEIVCFLKDDYMPLLWRTHLLPSVQLDDIEQRLIYGDIFSSGVNSAASMFCPWTSDDVKGAMFIFVKSTTLVSPSSPILSPSAVEEDKMFVTGWPAREELSIRTKQLCGTVCGG